MRLRKTLSLLNKTFTLITFQTLVVGSMYSGFCFILIAGYNQADLLDFINLVTAALYSLLLMVEASRAASKVLLFRKK